MRALIRCVIREGAGQNLIEYALLAALLGGVAAAAMTTVSSGVRTHLGRFTTFITTTPPKTPFSFVLHPGFGAGLKGDSLYGSRWR